MTYEEWESQVPAPVRQDSLWKMQAYRFGLFLSDLSWHDATKLAKDKRTIDISGQLYRATGKVSSSLAEGYSRGTGRDRARFYEDALGSVRESRDWYYKGRHILGAGVVTHRLDLCTDIIRLVLRMVSKERTTNRRVIAAG